MNSGLKAIHEAGVGKTGGWSAPAEDMFNGGLLPIPWGHGAGAAVIEGNYRSQGRRESPTILTLVESPVIFPVDGTGNAALPGTKRRRSGS